LDAELAVFLESDMPEKLMPWILLFAAILLEVAGITSMKLSRGFSEPLPSLAVPVFYVCSAAAVILALKRLDLSVTYAIWSGVGTALAAMIGIAYFAADPLQDGLSRARRHRRHWAVARRAAEQLTYREPRVTLPPWTVSSAKAMARSASPYSPRCSWSWR
jgi:small multidrug resistance pump